MLKEENGAAKLDGNGQVMYKYVDNGLKITSDLLYLGERIVFIDPDFNKVKVDFSNN